ncbi:helix-turn-helix transcriptional regulator [Bacillus sp. A301a_S52]|nr:helix-turn-helix transcriptional regulator [Bacillus sp. A301a_S52]
MKREKLINLRKSKKLTQEKLAEKIGISTVYVRKIENGDVDPGKNTLLKYQKYFNEEASTLFPDIFFSVNDKKLIGNSSA